MKYYLCPKCGGTFDPSYHYCPRCDSHTEELIQELKRLADLLEEGKRLDR